MTVPSSPPADRPGEQAATEAATHGIWQRVSARIMAQGHRPATVPNDYAEFAAAAVAAAYPIIAAALADKIDEAAPTVDEGNHSPTARTVRIVMATGYETAASIVRAAAARSGVSE